MKPEQSKPEAEQHWVILLCGKVHATYRSEALARRMFDSLQRSVLGAKGVKLLRPNGTED